MVDRQTVGALMLLTALTSAQAAGITEPLQCPSGAQLKVRDDPKDNSRHEWCVDAKTGLPEGPDRETKADGRVAVGANVAGKHHGIVRLYDTKGVLVGEMTYEHGEFRSMRMTVAGLNQYVEKLNQGYRSSGSPFSIRVIDERTLGFDYRFSDANAVTGAERLDEFKSFARTNFCELLKKGKLLQVESFQVRVFNDKSAKPQMETSLSRSECAAAAN